MIPGPITRPVAVQPSSANWDPAVQAGMPQPIEPGQKPAPVQGANPRSTSGNVGSVARWRSQFHHRASTPETSGKQADQTLPATYPYPARSKDGLGRYRAGLILSAGSASRQGRWSGGLPPETPHPK